MISRIAFVWTLAAMVLAGQSSTTTGSIGGTVQEKTGGGTPLAGAGVRLSPGGKSADTDAKGHDQIKDLAPGTYSVMAHSAGGYGSHGAKTVQIGAGQDLALDFQLARWEEFRAVWWMRRASLRPMSRCF